MTPNEKLQGAALIRAAARYEKHQKTDKPAPSTWVIFRKSANTNSFGLRGYWEYNPETRALREFATSRELDIGDVVTEPTMGFTREIPASKGTVALHRRALFEKALPFKIVKHGIVVKFKCDTGKTWTQRFNASEGFASMSSMFQGTELTFGDGTTAHEVYIVELIRGITYTTEKRA